MDFLLRKGINVGRHYPVPAHLCPVYANGEFSSKKASTLKVTESYASSCISLPIDPTMTEESALIIASAVMEYTN